MHGHTPVDRVTHYGHRINLDSGTGYGRAVGVVVFEGRMCWQLTENGELCPKVGDGLNLAAYHGGVERAVILKEKGYATMTKSIVVPFELPSEFSPDPLTEVIQAGAKELLRTAVQAEVSAFIAQHAELLDGEGRQRLVRHGFLPEREVDRDWDGARTGAPRAGPRGQRGWYENQVPVVAGATISAQGKVS